jgi:hypothetical protein
VVRRVSLDEMMPVHEHRRLREQMLAKAAPRRDDPETWRLMLATEQEARDQARADHLERELVESRDPWPEVFRAMPSWIRDVIFDLDRG